MNYQSRFIFWGWNGILKTQCLLPQKRTLLQKSLNIFGFCALYLIFAVASITAATYTVTTTADNESNGCSIGQCTLREAVTAANVLSNSDTIVFQPSVTGTIFLTNGNLLISSDITITGPGARILSVSGNNSSRVFVVSGANAVANISGLTITGGNAVPILIGATLIGDGGGILNTNGGTLNLDHVTIAGNNATSLGGGVATRAILLTVSRTTISHSTINNNTSIIGGGGVSNVGTGIVSSSETEIFNSTITQNQATAEGGGLSNIGGILRLTNNTITHNQSTVAGGGIVNLLGVLVGQVYMRNNILARNHALIGLGLISSEGFGNLTSQGHNLIENNLDIAVSFAASLEVGGIHQPNVNADLVGSIDIGFNTLDPIIGSLANNGGQTDTRALLPGSPAINSGNSCVHLNTCLGNLNGSNLADPLLTDQRGVGHTRMSSTSTDIGAYEVQFSPTAASVTIGGKVREIDGRAIARALVTLTNLNGEIRTTVTNHFGYYSFKDVPAGENFVLSASHKLYEFTPQVVNSNEEQTGLDIIANYGIFKK